MSNCRHGLIFGSIVLVLSVISPIRDVYAEDFTNLGGALSTDFEGRHAIQATAPNVTDPKRIAAQAGGFSLFHRTTTPKDGLGPTFVNNSCAGCHINNGKGPASFGVAARGGSSMVIKIKGKGLLADLSPPPVPGFGEQILDQTVGTPIKRVVRLTWQETPGRYKDGTPYSLRKPRLLFPPLWQPPKGSTISLRMSPPMIGMGLLEAIPEADILGMNDPKDRDGDGVSGRVNWVANRSGAEPIMVGRFGFKGTHPTVLQQTASALYHDMQITNKMFKEEGQPREEASLDDLHSLAVYLRLAGVPKARNQTDSTVARGKKIFLDIGCETCHRATLTTGAHSDPELSNQRIHPFTDLLLHDMGVGLADGWSEFSATGREWRTTPLWGLGFSRQLSRGKLLFLHDGRARSIEEAILWHGGEAAASQARFKKLPRGDRQALIEFLNSL